MGSFLYWNLNKKNLTGDLVSLCDEHEVDFLVLSECVEPINSIVLALNSGSLGGYTYFYDPEPNPKLKWFTRYPVSRLSRVLDGGGISVVRISLLNGMDVLAAAVHLTSKINANDDDQLYEASLTSAAIRSVEKACGISKTLVFGDFNMNPFDKGMAAVSGFNAVMDREIAKRGTVTYKGEEFPMFYNPMWSFLGDNSKGPPGTHYFSRRLVRFYWNTYDQVIFISGLFSSIKDDGVKVVDSVGGSLLAGSGARWKSLTDHLPVFIRIEE